MTFMSLSDKFQLLLHIRFTAFSRTLRNITYFQESALFKFVNGQQHFTDNAIERP